jgi:hypothetical protein
MRPKIGDLATVFPFPVCGKETEICSIYTTFAYSLNFERKRVIERRGERKGGREGGTVGEV